MSLRFKVGDLALFIGSSPIMNPLIKRYVGEVCQITRVDIQVGPVPGGWNHKRADYMVSFNGDDGWCVYDSSLQPLPGDSSSRSSDTGELDPAWKRMREFLQVAAEVQREKQKERV